ncbi:MAG: hypothetical protein OXD29_14360, partial [Roseovarius sp.]|nr:hypothetical protein [Roseovarius sp.]
MRQHFGGIPDPIRTRGTGLSDCLMSGLAVFFFKTPSLPRFDRNTRGGGDPVMARNLHALFGVARAKQQSPSGCAGASTRSTRGPCAGASRRCHAALRRGTGKPDRARRSFPMAVDGTGHHSSKTVKCKSRRVRNHQGRNLYLRNEPRSLVRRFAFPDRETLSPALSGEIK